MTAPTPLIFGADVTADGVAVVRAGTATPASIRGGAVREHGLLWSDVLREQEAFFARCDACSLVLPVDPVGEA
ncbi:hypothetical protein ACN9MF_11530 [Methylobacterium fujisawaense]|uniref:hypothetical protein n=1 Tax=Methylobacterium fujisawaense TaxID=107400 RepID=UPI003CF37B6F